MAKIIRGPGVFIEEVPNPLLISQATGILTAAIVGTSPSTFLVKNVAVVKGSGSTDNIPNTISSDVNSITSIGDYPDVPKYALTTDYTLSGNTITWVGSNKPPTAATYYVTFKQNKGASFYIPHLFTNIDDVRANHGFELDAGNLSPITAAAKMMFDNGAARVMVVQATDGSDSAAESALDLLQKEDVQVIVMPGITDATLQPYLKAHVDAMSSVTQRKERIGFIAPLTLSDSASVIEAQSAAYADERIINMAPPSVNILFHDSTSNQDATLSVSSIYSAAGIAGRLVNPNVSIAEPLTRKQVVGVVSLGAKYLETEMDTLAGAGTLVLVQKQGGPVLVRQALTTDVSSVDHSEISVVMIKDHIRNTVRDDLDATFIGTQIKADTPASVASRIKVLLTSEINKSIVAFQNISARQDSIDPTTITVSFQIKPIFPCNYISISFSLFV